MDIADKKCVPLFLDLNSSKLKIALFLIVTFVVYKILVQLGWVFFLGDVRVSTLWLATGLLLWVFVVSAQKYWLLIACVYFFADILVSYFTGVLKSHFYIEILGTITIVGETCLGAWLLSRFSFRISHLYSTRGISLFLVLGVFVSTALFAFIGALGVYLANGGAKFFNLYFTWMTSDALGELLLFPLLVSWLNHRHSSSLTRKDIEATIFVIISSAISYYICSIDADQTTYIFQQPYMIIALLAISVIRYEEKYTILLMFIFTMMAMYFTNLMQGPFIHWHRLTYDDVIATQVFIAVVSLVTLLLTAVYSELKREIKEKSIALTEKKQAEVKLRHAQKVEVIGNLSAGIAHDFNNTLTSLGGYIKLARNHVKDSDKKMSHYLKQIQQGANRGKDIIDKLMAFSRSNEDNVKRIDLNSFIEERLDYYQVSVTQFIQFEFQAASESPKIWIDPVQLDQIVINLLVNARDAIESKGTINVTVENGRYVEKTSNVTFIDFSGSYICVRIRDNGCGIKEELIEHVFEPFFTTKEIGQGTGLGLSTVYGIMAEIGGHIIVETELNVGSEFQLYFPVADS